MKTNTNSTRGDSPLSNAQHTPLPWHVGMKPGPIVYGPQGEQVADLRNLFLSPHAEGANARLIVRAVNSHADLLHALKTVLSEADFGDAELLTLCRAAVAKAEGRA